jgi:outer membrane protein TolC
MGFTGCLVSLFLVFCKPVVSNETEGKTTKVKELEQKRLAVLEKIHGLTKKGFLDGLISYEQLHTAKADLLSARLEYADAKKDRITICDEAVKDAKEWQKIVQEGATAKVFSQLDELRAESDLLEAQITREHADDDDE